MSDQPYLVTAYCFKGKDYIVKMNIFNKNTIEIKITDKITSETWHCSYDSTYIENLTHKTGNYKQFDIFTTMLKSGLLKTSESITLDLLTFDDLEALRSRRVMGRTFPSYSTHILPASASNRRYLILTYTVEFDRIHYPLPMEYCGFPDPQVLQATIRRMEHEIFKLQEKLKNTEVQNSDGYIQEQISTLEGRMIELRSENKQLKEEVLRLECLLKKKQPSRKNYDALTGLEEQFRKERSHLNRQVYRLRDENAHLVSQLEKSKSVEKNLRSQLHCLQAKSTYNFLTHQSRVDMNKRSPSRSNTDPHTCVTILKENPITNTFKKRNNKTLSFLRTKSNSPILQRNQRSSSGSSAEKHRKNSPGRFPSHSPHRSSSNGSDNSNRSSGRKSKVKLTKFPLRDQLSSESSTSLPETSQNKNFLKGGKKKSKFNKVARNDIKIQELENRIKMLQDILESDLTLNAKNTH